MGYTRITGQHANQQRSAISQCGTHACTIEQNDRKSRLAGPRGGAEQVLPGVQPTFADDYARRLHFVTVKPQPDGSVFVARELANDLQKIRTAAKAPLQGNRQTVHHVRIESSTQHLDKQPVSFPTGRESGPQRPCSAESQSRGYRAGRKWQGKLMRQHIRRAKRNDAQGDFGSDQPISHLGYRPVTARSHHHGRAVADGLACQPFRVSWTAGLQQPNRQTVGREYIDYLPQQRHPPPPGGGIEHDHHGEVSNIGALVL